MSILGYPSESYILICFMEPSGLYKKEEEFGVPFKLNPDIISISNDSGEDLIS